MKQVIHPVLIVLFLAVASISFAQTTAMDFHKHDCNGHFHNHFSELDSGNVTIIEFFMTCSSCISAGHNIETMLSHLNKQYPGKIKWYMMAFTNSYTCTTAKSFVSSNGFTAIPFDSGANLVAYYGGFGMPTVAVVAGSSHKVLFTTVGFTASDTTQMSNAIQGHFNGTSGIGAQNQSNLSFKVIPNPVQRNANVLLNLEQLSEVHLQLLDLSGKVVEEIYNGSVNSGVLENKIETDALAEGIYILKAIVDGTPAYQKVSVVK